MDLSNKVIEVKSLAVTFFPPSSRAEVVISHEVLEGVYVVDMTLQLTFEGTFQGTKDPELSNRIYEKLAAL